jgi:hydrogenase maturation protease
MKTAIIALGNPILGDDGIGWQVGNAAEQVWSNIRNSEIIPASRYDSIVDFIYLSCGGLELMEHMVDYDQVILIDAIFTGLYPRFSYHLLSLEDFKDTGSNHINSAHDTSLYHAIQLGQEIGIKLPEIIEIIGIEAEHVFEFSDQLSSELSDMIPEIAEFVITRLQAIKKMEVQHDLT